MTDRVQVNCELGGSQKIIEFLPDMPGGFPALRCKTKPDSGLAFNSDGTISVVIGGVARDILGAAADLNPDGTVLLPGMSFAAEPSSGVYRIGAGDLGVSILGVKLVEWTATGEVVSGTMQGTTITATTKFVSANGTAAAPTYVLSGFTTTGMYSDDGNIRFSLGGTQRAAITGSGIFADSFVMSLANGDTIITRDAANTLACRNGTNACLANIYNTFTDASNYERLAIGPNAGAIGANTFGIAVTQAGTGTARALYLATIGNTSITFRTNNSDKWSFAAVGDFQPATDVTYNIGTASFFVKDLYYRRRITKIATVTYSASMTPDASLGDMQVITVTNGTAFTINAPTNPLTGQWMELMMRNTSGGAVGAVTFNAVFKLAAWTSPATAFSRSITFRYDGTNWVETGRTTVDVPN